MNIKPGARKPNVAKAGQVPARAMDRPVGWIALLVIGAALAGGVYLAWGWFFPPPEPEPLVGLIAELAIPKEEEEAGPGPNNPGFFADYLKETSGPVSKAEDKKSPLPKLNASTPPGPAPAGMAWIPGGEFYMGIKPERGTERILGDANPVHLVYVDGFWLGKHEVTNEEFQRFVEETKYVTTVEKPPPKQPEHILKEVPEAKRRLLTEPWSAVFTQPDEPISEWENPNLWWKPVLGASWRHPAGPLSSIVGKEKHPVVHISWDDAMAYCKWLSKKTANTYRLPTEAEWEFAARGGLDRKKFVWGDEKEPGGKPLCNYWQGEFPNKNLTTDGHAGTAPVGSFPPNGYGLHDMAGNVWEWCKDVYKADYYAKSPQNNPQGPVYNEDPREPTVPFRVTRGGSFICSDNYCQRYIPAARHQSEQTAGWSHTGFRVLMEAPAPPAEKPTSSSKAVDSPRKPSASREDGGLTRPATLAGFSGEGSGLFCCCHVVDSAIELADGEKKPEPKLNPRRPPGPAPKEGMVWVRGGEFYMGSDSKDPLLRDARPMHLVYVDGFWMDAHEVTNEEFAKFVEATGYKTTAEKPPPKLVGVDLKDIPEEKRKFLTEPWSAVFKMPKEQVKDFENPTLWWAPTLGACWKHPEGPGSTIKGREKHPVVHVSWDDAAAYCNWAKKRLPTEAEWEFAARGGLDRKPFVWGDEKDPGGKPACNYWQGEFPNKNLKTDGFADTAPVGTFPPNGYGLFDMAGNVWEWVSDFYDAEYYAVSPMKNPIGPRRSKDPAEPETVFRVTRGGSFLCADNFCQRFIPPARMKSEQSATWNHTGFRCVMDAK